MSTPTFTERTMPNDFEGQMARLLPFLALFVRVSVGFMILNSGLLVIFAKNGGGNPFNNPGFGRGPTIPPGMDGLTTALPYAELALSVGLIFGIFTTISALLACLLSLLSPLLTTIALIANSGLGPGMNQFGMGFNFLSLLYPNQGVIAYVLVVALSPLSINRFSIDALIFRRPIGPLPQRGVDREAQTEINKLE